jgi:hypothetical protein
MLPQRREPAVTLQKRGTISMNRAAFTAIGSPDAVELLFDRDERIVGVRQVDGHSLNAHFVRPSTSAATGPYIISAMAFFNVYDIELDESRRWPAYLEDGVLCIALNSESIPVRRSRPATG